MPKNDPLFSFKWEGKAVGVNDHYAYRSAKVLNEAYAAFMDDIAWTCRAANPGLASQPISHVLLIRWTQIIDAARDADSLIKPLFDGIQLSGVITNDKKLRHGSWFTIDHERGAPDRIEVKAYEWENTDG